MKWVPFALNSSLQEGENGDCVEITWVGGLARFHYCSMEYSKF